MAIGNGWDDDWDSTLDWTSQVFWQMLLTQMYRRVLAAENGFFTPDSLADYLDDKMPDDLDPMLIDMSYYSNGPQETIRGIQIKIAALAPSPEEGSFLEPAMVAPDPIEGIVPTLDLNNLFGGAEKWWRRKRRRMIHRLTATHDEIYSTPTFGDDSLTHEVNNGANAREVGHRAAFFDNLPPSAFTTGYTQLGFNPLPLRYRGVYEWNGTTWVPHGGDIGTADMLDSDNELGEGSYVFNGAMIWGDIIALHIFDQIRTALKAMMRTYRIISFMTGVTNGAQDGSASGELPENTWASIKADAEGQYAINISTGSSAYAITAGTLSTGGAGTWSASISKSSAKIAVPGVYSGIAHETFWFAKAHKPSFGDPASVFDDNGTGLVEDTLSAWGSGVTAAGGAHAWVTEDSGNIEPAGLPTWCAEPVDAVGTSRGYFVYELGAIVDWTMGFNAAT